MDQMWIKLKQHVQMEGFMWSHMSLYPKKGLTTEIYFFFYIREESTYAKIVDRLLFCKGIVEIGRIEQEEVKFFDPIQ
jgi:hypothetical protein